MFKFKGYEIEKAILTDDEKIDLFSGVMTYETKGLPKEFLKVEEGYYFIKSLGQYFKLDDSSIKYGGEREISFPLWKKNIVMDYLDELSAREYQEKLAEILAEVTEFENDLNKELVFENKKAKLKNYYHKELSLVDISEEYELPDTDKGVYALIVNDSVEVEIAYSENLKKWSAYDGVDTHGWHDTVKLAVKGYMDMNYRYPTDEEYYEASCSNCGDGGCMYCEPNRFI